MKKLLSLFVPLMALLTISMQLWAVSPAQSADAEQAITANVTKILYDLSPIEGTDGITYTPIDLGYGVAWADKNVGASTVNDIGHYYYWAGTAARESQGSWKGYFNSSRIANNSTSSGYDLNVDAEDVANTTLGIGWHTPTQAQWTALKDNTDVDGNTFTNKADNSRLITLPASGYYTNTPENSQSSGNSSFLNGSYCYYQTTKLTNKYYTNSSYLYSTASQFTNASGSWGFSDSYVFTIKPVRAVYTPSFTTHTLTINVGTYHYDYICEHGQTVTITAVPDYDNLMAFKWWDDDHSNTNAERTFIVNADDEYTAVFYERDDVESHDAIFKDYDGTEICRASVKEGLKITYCDDEPTRSGYVFNGFEGYTSGTTRMGTSDMTFTATYLQVFTITATATSGTVTLTPANPTDEVFAGVYKSGASVTMTVNAPAGSAFVEWNDGNKQTPRVITVTADAAYTATVNLESADADVNVYEDVAANSITILYNLDEKDGSDNKKYKPVDLGYGVAWADRNVGASSDVGLGGWYRWGATTPDTNQNGYTTAGYQKSAKTLSGDAEDAATAEMGSNWRMPTTTEWTALCNNTDKSDNQKFKSKVDNNKFIIIPACGYFINYSNYSSSSSKSYQYYWTSQKSNSRNTCYAFIRTGENTYECKTTDNDGYTNNSQCHMQIRAIYVPSYTPCTLTVNIGSYSYKYLCQPGQNVTVTANANTGRVFDKWDDDDTHATRTFTVSSNMAYTATFKDAPVVSNYTVNFAADATGYGEVDAAAINDVPAGSPITVSGSTVTINGTPVTASITATDDEQYSYHFDGWTIGGAAIPNDATVDEDNITITANFSQTVNSYTVTWKNGEATLETDENVAYGATPEYNGATNPTKANDLVYSYTFAGWNDGTTTYGLSDNLPEVSGNVTYTAVYNSADLATFDLVDNIDAGGLYNGHDYYAAIATLKDQTRNVTYHRTMEAGKWHVVSLPFNFNLILNSSHTFANNIYELTDVTYSDGGYLNFEFTPMTTMMMANKPYVFYSTTEAKDVTFNGVTFAKLEKYTGDGASIGITGGSVDFINTTSRIQLTNGNKRQIYIYNNKLYYPGSDAAYMRAFRGYFYLNGITINHVTPRMRIVLDGQTATELEMTESGGAADEVRKYMENGVMVIERNGVKYNAQGGRME